MLGGTGMTEYRISEDDLRRLAQELRQQMMDEYGTAAHFFPAAQVDLARIEMMSDEEIIEEAARQGMI